MAIELDLDMQKKLDLVMAGINKEYGAGSIMHLGNEEKVSWPSISTGAATLDKALGIGGVPVGRIIEIFGPESSGKSTVALSIVAEAQNSGKIAAYVDVESALDPIYMRNLGIDLDNLLLSQPDWGEQALNIVEDLVRSGVVDVIVVDSVAALTPKAELEGDFEQQHVGLLPRIMSKAMRKLTPLVRSNNVSLIFINQIREKVGVMFGNPEIQPGGRALKFAASVRIDVRKQDFIKDKESGDIAGIEVKAKVIKNKMAPPFKTADYSILYGKGVDKVGCLFDLAFTMGMFTKSGAWYAYKGESFAQGRRGAIDKLAQEPEILQAVKDTVYAQ